MPVCWTNISSITDPQVRRFAQLFTDVPPEQCIRNVHTEVRILKVNDALFFPVTINQLTIPNSFVCSPYTAFALYAEDELKKIKQAWWRWPLKVLIRLLAFTLRKVQFDRNVHVNNFLLSTNPYPIWSGDEIEEITRFLTLEFPDHAIIFRSLNRYQHEDLLLRFEQQGYDRIGSRQVYLFDITFEQWRKRQNNQHDARILRKQLLQYVSHENMKPYLADALTLYRQLYLEKYSGYNPQFTLRYFQQAYELNLMHFQGYADNNGKLRAFAGLFIHGGTITSPLVGYDTKAPQKQGLYIHAIRLVMQYTFEQQQILNLSSGAASFKRLRGGKPSMEYSVVYSFHLPAYRRFTIAAIRFVANKIGVPLLEKYEL